MPHKFNQIYFDLDGTLSDSYLGIENGIRYALKSAGISDISEHQIKQMIGMPLTESIKQFYFQEEDKIWEIVHDFRTYYSEKGIYESSLYPGIKSMLEEIAQKASLYVITAKPTVYAEKLLQAHQVDRHFKAIKGCSLEGGNFKKSDLIQQENRSSKSIMVGDKKQDIQAGKANEIYTCGVKYGYASPLELENENPDFIMDSVLELHELLMN
jgi:phosphoglycolate phosphatase